MILGWLVYTFHALTECICKSESQAVDVLIHHYSVIYSERRAFIYAEIYIFYLLLMKRGKTVLHQWLSTFFLLIEIFMVG